MPPESLSEPKIARWCLAAPLCWVLLPACAGIGEVGQGEPEYTENLDDWVGKPVEWIPEPPVDVGEVPAPLPDCPSDACQVASGITHRCQKRFALGANYAWRHFGGIQSWGTKSISRDPVSCAADFAKMRASGASVVRFWMFPDLRGDGIVWDEADFPVELGETVLDDLETVLDLAQQNNLELLLTWFSFDAFRGDRVESGLRYRNLGHLALEEAKRRALLENIVRPIAEALEKHLHHNRLFAWDLMNEPEWAIVGSNLYGGEDFTP